MASGSKKHEFGWNGSVSGITMDKTVKEQGDGLPCPVDCPKKTGRMKEEAQEQGSPENDFEKVELSADAIRPKTEIVA